MCRRHRESLQTAQPGRRLPRQSQAPKFLLPATGVAGGWSDERVDEADPDATPAGDSPQIPRQHSSHRPPGHNGDFACQLEIIPPEAPGMATPAWLANRSESVLQIGDQVVGILNAHGVPDQCFGNAAGGPLLACGLYVARSRRWAGDRFDRPKIGCKVGISQPWKRFLYRSEAPLQNKTEDAAIPAHLTAGDSVVLMRFQARIKDRRNLRMSFEETGNQQRALVLLAYAQVQSFHPSQQQVGGHRVEAGSGNFAEVVNPVDQFPTAANSTAERVSVSAEKFRRAVNRKIGAQFQGLLIDRGRKGVINNDERTTLVRSPCKPRQVDYFVGRISWAFEVQDVAALRDGRFNRRVVSRIAEGYVDLKPRQEFDEEFVGSPVSIVYRYNPIFGREQRKERIADRGHAAGKTGRRFGALQSSYLVFERTNRGIGIASVNVPGLFS